MCSLSSLTRELRENQSPWSDASKKKDEGLAQPRDQVCTRGCSLHSHWNKETNMHPIVQQIM
jgi:hypothetical protein